MIVVQFTLPEVIIISNVAAMRHTMSRKLKVNTKGAPQHRALAYNIDGAWGEAALAKALNRWWSGEVGNYKAKDVDGIWQVKATSLYKPRLWNRKDRKTGRPLDNPDDPYLLVKVDQGNFTAELAGWMWGHEIQRDDWWDEDMFQPNWFVPENVPLRPFRLEDVA